MLMDYNRMSLNINRLGKQIYTLTYKNSSNIAVNSAFIPNITDIQRNIYAPFTRFRIINDSSAKLEVRLNSTILGNNTLQNSDYIWILPANSIIETEDIDINKIWFSSIVIKNIDSVAIVDANKIILTISNW